jgi:hypothetical protein
MVTKPDCGMLPDVVTIRQPLNSFTKVNATQPVVPWHVMQHCIASVPTPCHCIVADAVANHSMVLLSVVALQLTISSCQAHKVKSINK